MAKSEWGRKRTCQSCATKYYDFNKLPMICPSCGAEFDLDLSLRNKKGRGPSPKSMNANDNDLTEDISSIDDLEIEADNEVVSDDDPLLEINKEEKSDITEDEIAINNEISFIDDNEISEEDEISDDNSLNVEVSNKDKD